MPKFGNVSIESGSGALEFEETIQGGASSQTGQQGQTGQGTVPFRPPINVPAANKFVSYIVASATPFINQERVLVAGSGISLLDNGPNSTFVISINDAALNVNSSVEIQESGTTIGVRPTLNFIAGDNIVLNVSDDSSNNKVDIEVSATGGGGFGSGTVRYVGLQGQNGITVANSPITVSGTATISLQTTGVAPGTYNNLTVDQFGRVTSGNNQNYITGITVSSKPGTGQSLLAEASGGVDFTFKKISGAGNIEVRQTLNSIIVSAPTPPTFAGVTQVAVSGGQGISVAGSPVTSTGTIDVSLTPTPVTPGTYNRFTVDQYGRITNATTQNYINNLTVTQVDTGVGTIIDVSGNSDVRYRGVTGGGIVNVSQVGQAIRVSAPAATINVHTSSMGNGAIATAGVSASEIQYKSFEGGGSVVVSAGPRSVSISAAPNPTNLSQLVNDTGFISNAALILSAKGTGLNVIAEVSGSEITQRPILQGGIVEISQQPTGEILVSAPRPELSVVPTGTGAELITGVTGTEITQATIVGGGAISVEEIGGEIVVSAVQFAKGLDGADEGSMLYALSSSETILPPGINGQILTMVSGPAGLYPSWASAQEIDLPESDIITGYGGNNWVWASAAGSAVTVGVNGTEVVTITSSGMDITGTGVDSSIIHFTTNITGTSADSGTHVGIPGGTGEFQILNYEQENVSIGTWGQEVITVTPSGNVGIGTSSPTAKLEIFDADSNSSQIQFTTPVTGTGPTDGALVGVADGSSDFSIVNGGVEALVADNTGMVTVTGLTVSGESAYTLPASAGSAGEILTSDGAGNVYWGQVSAAATTAIEQSPLGGGAQVISSISAGTDILHRTLVGSGSIEVYNSGNEVIVSAPVLTPDPSQLDGAAEGSMLYTVNSAESVLVPGTEGQLLVMVSSPAGLYPVWVSAQDATLPGNDIITGYGGSNWVWASAAGSTVTVGVNGTQVITVTPSGNVGIGTSAPTAKFEVFDADASDAFIQFSTPVTGTSADSGTSLGIPSGSSDFEINNRENANIKIKNNGIEAVDISNTGMVTLAGLTVSAEGVYTFPVSGGSAGEVLTSNGAGDVYWAPVSTTGTVNIQEVPLGSGEGVIVATSGAEIQHRTITAGGAIELSATPTDIILSAAPNPTNLSELTNDVGFLADVSARGAGEEIILVSGSELHHKTLVAGSNVNINSSGDEITISAVISGAGGTLNISDEGVQIGAAGEIDFVGANVSASFSGGVATVNVGGPEKYAFRVNFNSSQVIDSTNPVSNLPSGWTASFLNANEVEITHTVGRRPGQVTFHGFTVGSAYRANGGLSSQVYMGWDSATETTVFRIFITGAAQALSEANGHCIIDLVF